MHLLLPLTIDHDGKGADWINHEDDGMDNEIGTDHDDDADLLTTRIGKIMIHVAMQHMTIKM